MAGWLAGSPCREVRTTPGDYSFSVARKYKEFQDVGGFIGFFFFLIFLLTLTGAYTCTNTGACELRHLSVFTVEQVDVLDWGTVLMHPCGYEAAMSPTLSIYERKASSARRKKNDLHYRLTWRRRESVSHDGRKKQ